MNLPDYMKYTDENNVSYILTRIDYIPNSHACHGCAFKFGNSRACQNAKTCTPRLYNPSGFQPLVKGRHVWVESSD